jgi:hypothetical protein
MGAAEQGAAAAANAVSVVGPEAFSTVPYFWSDWYGERIQLTGHAAGADEVVTVDGSFDSDSFTALYRSGGRLIAALCLNQPAKVMKYRRLIAARGTWEEANAMFAHASS